MKQKSFEAVLYSTLGVAVMFVAVVGFNIVAAALKQRVDLTAEKAHTLSDGTRAILKKLDTPVKVRFYCTQVENATPETVFLTTYAKQVEDLLDELRQESRGRLVLEKFNPQPDSDAEDRAKMDGIEGQPLPPYGEGFYLGVALSQLDETVALPFLSPTREKLLEYDIVRAVSQVMKPEKATVGVLSGLPVFGMPMNPMMMQMGRQQGQDPWIFINELKRDFNVKEVPMSADKIDDDIKVLVLIYPKDPSETLQYALDQFVLRGGKLVAFLDPKSLADSGNAMMNPLQRATGGGATLDKLLKAWGLEFDVSKVVADMNYKTTLRGRNGQPEENPTVLSLTHQAVATDDILTSQIDNVWLPYSGVFTGTAASGLKQTVLLRTSPNSQLVDKVMAEFGVSDKDFKPSGTQYALAVRLTGKFKTAFPDGKPGAKSDDKKPDASPKDADAKEPAKADGSLKESAQENSVTLFGDSDLLFDPVVAQVQNIFGQKIVIPQNGNLNLGQSLVEQLGSDSNLIAVRSRATLNRPFTVVKAMEEKAQERYRGKIKELEAGLQETQTKLNELQRTKENKGQQRFVLSPEQQQELANFRKKEGEAKKELKQVRKDLRHDIDSMENRLKWVNIALMPLAVTLSGILVAVYKRKKTAAK
jgi:ABC-type uncharacterized transport system involved in gliding motility auxiliary subunit